MLSVRTMNGAAAKHHAAPPRDDDASVEGQPELTIADADREAVADTLADLLLAALAREGLIGSAS